MARGQRALVKCYSINNNDDSEVKYIEQESSSSSDIDRSFEKACFNLVEYWFRKYKSNVLLGDFIGNIGCHDQNYSR